jgi:AAA domain
MAERSTGVPVCQTPAELLAAELLATDPLPNIIPAGGISLLAGGPNVGKTALLATMLRHLRDGQPIFGHQPNPVSAIGMISADRGWVKGAGVWFRRAGFADILRYSMVDDRTFDPRSLRRKFERTARLMEMADTLKLPPKGLLCVDPIGLFLGGNLNDYDSCAVACHEIRAMLRDRDLTIWATAHSAKLKADKKDRYLRLQDQILGSTAIFGFSDTQMYLASPEEIQKPHYAFLWAPHSAPPETFALERDEQGLFVPYSGADQGNCTRVLALFPADEVEVSTRVLQELAEVIPLSRATLFRVLETLLDRGRIEKVRHGSYRRLALH